MALGASDSGSSCARAQRTQSLQTNVLQLSRWRLRKLSTTKAISIHVESRELAFCDWKRHTMCKQVCRILYSSNSVNLYTETLDYLLGPQLFHREVLHLANSVPEQHSAACASVCTQP